MAESQSDNSAEPLLQVIDGLVPETLHSAACTVCMGNTWYFGNRSTDAHSVPFWKMDLDGVAAFDAVWDSVRSQCEALVGGPLRVVRQYANGHTYGQGGRPHWDDNRPGTFTLLYYPMTEWQDHWEGETVFHDARGEVMQAVRPRPNRGVLFDSRIPHAGRAPSRSCPALRVTVAFKLERIPIVAERIAQIEATPTATAESLHYTETNRQGALREYSVRFDAALVDARVGEELESIGKCVRLPGFRAGKIPASVLQQRYGSRAREAAVRALMEGVVQSVAPKGALISSVLVTGGADSGDLEGKITVTFVSDLPDIDFSAMELERLVPDAPDDEAAAEANLHLREQVLDRLATAWDFVVAPALVEREFAALRKAAEQQLDPGEDLTELTAQLREVAERRIRTGIVVAETARRQNIRIASDTPPESRGRVLEEKVVNWIVSQAHVSERRVSVQELRSSIG